MTNLDDLRRRVERLERVVEAAYKAFKAPPPDDKPKPGVDSIDWMPVAEPVRVALRAAGLTTGGQLSGLSAKKLIDLAPALTQKQAEEVVRLVRQWEIAVRVWESRR